MVAAIANRTVSKLLDFCFPPRCLSCRKIVSGADGLCPDCFAQILFIAEPACRKCGSPFEFAAAEEGGVCVNCRHNPPPWSKLVAVAVYDEFSRRLILPLKHSDDTAAARFLAILMADRGWEILKAADMLVPVPLGRRRLFRRMYNQSTLLAKVIGRMSGKPVSPCALARKGRKTEGQKGLSKLGRAANVEGVFKVAEPEFVKGGNIVLVDDVITTGATLSECARVLKGAGAKSVSCLVFTKAIRSRK